MAPLCLMMQMVGRNARQPVGVKTAFPCLYIVKKVAKYRIMIIDVVMCGCYSWKILTCSTNV